MHSHSKRGQVTVFVILGLLIFSIVIIFLVFISGKTSISDSNTLEIYPIQSYVEQCIQKTAQDALLSTGEHGGYMVLPGVSTSELAENVPIFSTTSSSAFSPEVVTTQIAQYIDTTLDLCLSNFPSFVEQGYTFSYSPSTSTTTLTPTDLSIQTKLSLTITKGTKTKTITNFSTSIPSQQFYQDLNVGREIVQSSNHTKICLSCFASSAALQNLLVQILPLPENVTLIDIEDQDYQINNQNFHVRFAIR